LLSLEGIGEKSAQNILAAIDESRSRDFGRVLHALGIRHVGRTTASVLALAFGSMDSVMDASIEDLSKVDGIGPVVAKSVKDFAADPENRTLVSNLAGAGLHMEGSKRVDGPLSGKTFLFTGELEALSRSEAGGLVESLGGKVSDNVTKATDYVVVGASPGSKLEKAKRMGKTILGEREFLRLVGRG
jgi:DNA ligase (NAD+)